MFGSVALGKREASDAVGGEFQHGSDRLRRADLHKRQRCRSFDDLDNPAFAVKEEHVQWQVSVFHPHDNLLRRIVQEKHAVLCGQPCAEHETAALLCGRCGELDDEPVARALARMQDQRLRAFSVALLFACRLRGRGGDKEEARRKPRENPRAAAVQGRTAESERGGEAMLSVDHGASSIALLPLFPKAESGCDKQRQHLMVVEVNFHLYCKCFFFCQNSIHC